MFVLGFDGDRAGKVSLLVEVVPEASAASVAAFRVLFVVFIHEVERVGCSVVEGHRTRYLSIAGGLTRFGPEPRPNRWRNRTVDFALWDRTEIRRAWRRSIFVLSRPPLQRGRHRWLEGAHVRGIVVRIPLLRLPSPPLLPLLRARGLLDCLALAFGAAAALRRWIAPTFIAGANRFSRGEALISVLVRIVVHGRSVYFPLRAPFFLEERIHSGRRRERLEPAHPRRRPTTGFRGHRKVDRSDRTPSRT